MGVMTHPPADPDQHAKWVLEHMIRSSVALGDMIQNIEPASNVVTMALYATSVFRRGGKLLICGNGGSAAESQHIAAELVVKMSRWRRALPAVALGVDGAVMTAEANDESFGEVFARQVMALGNTGDILLVLSSSGNSKNVLRALVAAGKLGMMRFGFGDRTGGAMKQHCDAIFLAPSQDTAVVQQLHGVATHLFCGVIEREFCR